MMRKDVKLGFAIGGVLLAVLVVYVLVGTGGGDRNTASNTPAAIVTEDNSGKAPTDGTKVAGAGTDVSPNSSNGTTMPPTADPLAANHKASEAAAAKSANDEIWGDALNNGKLLLTQTPDANSKPTPAPTGDIPGGGNPEVATNSPANTSANVGTNTGRANAPADVHNGSDANANSGGPSTQPSDTTAPRATENSGANNTGANIGGSTAADRPAGTAGSSRARSHIVQKGETLMKIAQMAYGSANYYPAIKRANPNIDEKKLKPGMTIVLPAVNDVKPDASGAAEPASASVSGMSAGRSSGSSLDPKTQYRVESGDTLERIALKLYGKREMIQKIQDANKDVLPDPNKLKLNMVLKLPEPPTKG